MRIRPFALGALLMAAGLGCAALLPARAAATSAAAAPDRLTIEQALTLAAQNRQELAGLGADLDSAAVGLDHAGQPLNPELGIEWDNLGGDLPADEVRETTVSLRQPVEIGGKPSARRNWGRAEMLRLRQEQTTTWLAIAAEVRAAFLQVLVARERLTLQQGAEQIAAELAAITRERVAAGELPVTEEIRAEARRAETGAETQKYTRLLVEAELALTATLADSGGVPLTAAGELPREVAIPDLETLLTGLRNSPQLALRRSENEQAAAGLVLEQANAWADPALTLALRDIPDKDGSAVLVGISIPLPLFQRNQTALAAAGAAVRKTATKEAAETHRLRTELRQTHGVLVAADREARTLRHEVLRRASEAEASVREGFRAGKFRYSDVLEVSQSLVAIQARHLDALLTLNQAAIALDRLQGQPAYPAAAQNSSLSMNDRSNP